MYIVIFNLQEAVNSAVLGAAYQAKHGLLRATGSGDGIQFSAITSCLPPLTLACKPYPDAAQVVKDFRFNKNIL